jgi:hypothetical protein
VVVIDSVTLMLSVPKAAVSTETEPVTEYCTLSVPELGRV